MPALLDSRGFWYLRFRRCRASELRIGLRAWELELPGALELAKMVLRQVEGTPGTGKRLLAQDEPLGRDLETGSAVDGMGWLASDGMKADWTLTVPHTLKRQKS